MSQRLIRIAGLVLGLSAANGWSADAAAQSFNEFQIPTTASDSNGITVGPDGALWFTEEAGNKIGRITTDGIIAEFPIPTAKSFPNGIVAGPDGALWFTEPGANKIGRIPTTATPGNPQITEYPAAGYPYAIALGSDGALWFTELFGNKIGRIPPTATPGNPQVTEYPISTGNSGPVGIATGSDGALWFTELFGNKIGRIPTTATPLNSQITEYPIPTQNSSPDGIAAGPDGALWYFEDQANQIGRIPTTATPTNPQIAEFKIPAGKNVRTYIAAGPDSALWFTDGGGNKIGRIPTTATQGNPQITEYPIPTTNSGPVGITTGPDSALWFTEYAGGKIGRFGLACEYQIDCNFLQKHEGLLFMAYIPTNAGVPRGASGVTTSMGVDLGSGIISPKELEQVFNNNANDPAYIAFSTVLGKKAVKAEEALAKLTNPIVPPCVLNYPYNSRCVFSTLAITLGQAQMLFDDAESKKLAFLVPAWASFTKALYPASAYQTFSALPPEGQTVLFDLIYAGQLHTTTNEKSSPFAIQSKRFWDDMIDNLWSQAVFDLQVLATMAKDLGLRSRIYDDAVLLQSAKFQ